MYSTYDDIEQVLNEIKSDTSVKAFIHLETINQRNLAWKYIVDKKLDRYLLNKQNDEEAAFVYDHFNLQQPQSVIFFIFCLAFFIFSITCTRFFARLKFCLYYKIPKRPFFV
jgi:hypothetical protein